MRVYTYAVATPSSQSPADALLAEEASRIAGRRITTGQIRRWRRAGLLPMTRKGLGRARGFRYEYPKGSAEFAAAIARELPRYRRLDLAAKAAFARGTSPGSAKVLSRLLDDSDLVTPVLEEPHRTATRLANKGSRRASTSPAALQVKDALDRPGQLADFFRGAFGSVLAGETTSLKHAFRLLHMSEETTDDATRRIDEDFGGPGMLHRSFQVMADVLKEATLAEFERARDDAIAVYRGSLMAMSALAKMIGLNEQIQQDEVEAMGLIPVLLVIRKEGGDEAAEGLLRLWGEPISYFGQVIESMRTWATENPDDAAIVWPIARTLLERSLAP